MRRPVLLLAGFFVLASTACLHYAAVQNPEGPPRAPPFDTGFTDEDIHSAMWALARRAQEVDLILRAGKATPEERVEVVRLLDEMLVIAGRLGEDKARSSHPMLAHHIDRFIEDVKVARAHASADPPNYFMAGTIAGSCSNCHGRGPGKVR